MKDKTEKKLKRQIAKLKRALRNAKNPHNRECLDEAEWGPRSCTCGVEKLIAKPKPKKPAVEDTCYICFKKLVKKSGRYGEFLGCPAFPDCRGARNLDGTIGRSHRSATEHPDPGVYWDEYPSYWDEYPSDLEFF